MPYSDVDGTQRKLRVIGENPDDFDADTIRDACSDADDELDAMLGTHFVMPETSPTDRFKSLANNLSAVKVIFRRYATGRVPDGIRIFDAKIQDKIKRAKLGAHNVKAINYGLTAKTVAAADALARGSAMDKTPSFGRGRETSIQEPSTDMTESELGAEDIEG